AAAVQALDALQNELARLHASEQAGSRVVDELARAAESARTELEAANGALQAAADAERAAREGQATLEADRLARQQQHHEGARETAAIEAELRQLEGRRQFLTEQQQQARSQLEAWSVRHGSLGDEVDRRTRTAEAATRALADVNEANVAIEQRVGENEAELETARKAIVEHEAALRTLEAELGALRTLLDGAQRRGPLRIGRNWERLLELIEADAIHRGAVQAALEGWLHGWVAPGQDGIASAASALAGAEDARETLLHAPQDMSTSPAPDGLLSVIDLVQAADHVRWLVAHLLRGVVLVAD